MVAKATVGVSFRWEPELLDLVREVAAARSVSVSSLVRGAVLAEVSGTTGMRSAGTGNSTSARVMAAGANGFGYDPLAAPAAKDTDYDTWGS